MPLDDKLDMLEAIDEARALFWGAIGECDANNESASCGLDAAMEFLMDYMETQQAKTDAIIRNADHAF